MYQQVERYVDLLHIPHIEVVLGAFYPFQLLLLEKKVEYSNVDRSQWTPRTVEDHKQAATKHKGKLSKKILAFVTRC